MGRQFELFTEHSGLFDGGDHFDLEARIGFSLRGEDESDQGRNLHEMKPLLTTASTWNSTPATFGGKGREMSSSERFSSGPFGPSLDANHKVADSATNTRLKCGPDRTHSLR